MDGNLKLILGLVWTLILHYSISMPVWEEDEDEESKKATPKQRLLNWVQNKVPDLPISNFSENWRDGRALGALVDSCAPGECVEACVSRSRWTRMLNLMCRNSVQSSAFSSSHLLLFVCIRFVS